MTPEQVSQVQTSFAHVVPIADQAADLFYDRLFELDPSLRRLFKDDLAAQKRALVGMLAMVVNGLDRLDTIVPAVQQLGSRHATYGVQDSHYATVGSALLWTLEQGLGERFQPQTREAWTAAYTLLSDTMKAAAHNN
jgi:hemoglobin-like flavoprotein